MAFGEDIDPKDKKKKKLQVQIQEPPVDRFDECMLKFDICKIKTLKLFKIMRTYIDKIFLFVKMKTFNS